MFSFDVNNKILFEIKSILKDIKRLNIPISQNIHFRECYGIKNAGWCKKVNESFIIAINKNMVFKKDFQETIIHELLHTVDGCLAHNKKWKQYALFCSKTFEVEIQIKGSVYMLNNGESYVEQDIKIRHIKFDKQLTYLEELLQNDLEYLFSNINQLCCYLSQDNRDYLFLYLRKNISQIWFDIKNIEIATCLDSCVTKKAKHILANNYLKGEYDSFILDYKRWVCFSSVWALTKDYVKCSNRYSNISKRNGV